MVFSVKTLNFLVSFFISGWVFPTTNCYFDPWYIMYIYAIYRNIMHILCKNYYLYMQKYANENWAHVKILIWETAAVITSSDINFPAGHKNSISSNSYNCFNQCFKQNEHVKKVSWQIQRPQIILVFHWFKLSFLWAKNFQINVPLPGVIAIRIFFGHHQYFFSTMNIWSKLFETDFSWNY